MKKFFTKPFRWAFVFSVILTGFFAFVLLDAFVIPKPLSAVEAAETTVVSKSASNFTDTSYQDENIKITIETLRKYDSTLYVADIQLADAEYLKTAFAGDTYGRNIKAATSEIAAANDAIFAINADNYGFRDSGYVLRNGVIYRNISVADDDAQALVIDNGGNFSIIDESETSMESLPADSIWQILSFGPALIENGKIVVDGSSEVDKSMSSNPRTAIGQVSELHYIVIVSDGRTDESAGLTLLEIAEEFAERGCTTAYNLDGGGSSTMVFNDQVINNPTDGRGYGEREVNDIVYIGY